MRAVYLVDSRVPDLSAFSEFPSETTGKGPEIINVPPDTDWMSSFPEERPTPKLFAVVPLAAMPSPVPVTVTPVRTRFASAFLDLLVTKYWPQAVAVGIAGTLIVVSAGIVFARASAPQNLPDHERSATRGDDRTGCDHTGCGACRTASSGALPEIDRGACNEGKYSRVAPASDYRHTAGPVSEVIEERRWTAGPQSYWAHHFTDSGPSACGVVGAPGVCPAASHASGVGGCRAADRRWRRIGGAGNRSARAGECSSGTSERVASSVTSAIGGSAASPRCRNGRRPVRDRSVPLRVQQPERRRDFIVLADRERTGACQGVRAAPGAAVRF